MLDSVGVKGQGACSRLANDSANNEKHMCVSMGEETGQNQSGHVLTIKEPR